MLSDTTVHLRSGFSERSATVADVAMAADLLNACAQAMLGINTHKAEELLQEWLAPDFDLETGLRLVFAPNGDLVGYMEVWDSVPVPVNIWVWGRVHPQYEGQGIGTYLMDWAEDRARRAVDRVAPDLQVSMQSGALSIHQPSRQLFEGQGMALVRHFYTMKIEFEGVMPSAPEWPEGITVRPFNGTDAEFAAIVRADEEAFSDHWGYVEIPFEEVMSFWRHFYQDDPEWDSSLWFVALDGDEIAGISLCQSKTNEDADMGWVKTLGVRRPWRRRGVALALLQHSFQELYRRGSKRAALGVDASSLTGALHLYEKAGMSVARQFDRYEKVLRPGRDLRTRSVTE